MKVVNSKEMFDLEKQALASGISEKKNDEECSEIHCKTFRKFS